MNRPVNPLRWWEELTLWLLVRSPRIAVIYVIQPQPTTTPTSPARPPIPRTDPNHSSYVNYLEHLINIPDPPEDSTRQG